MILPRPPHRLDSRYLARQRRLLLILGGIGVLLLLGGLWLLPNRLRSIRRDGRIWALGDSAPALKVSGFVTGTQRLLWDHRLDVSYTDAAGAHHQGVSQFTTLLAPADTQTAPFVRYLPGTPDSFALSWAHRAESAQWDAFAALVLVVLGSACPLLVIAYRGPLRQLRALAACASGPYTELSLEVVSATPTRHPGVVHYELHGRAPSGREYRFRGVGDSQFGQPLFLDPAHRTVLALVATAFPGVPVVVRETLAPFAFAEVDRHRIAANLPGRVV